MSNERGLEQWAPGDVYVGEAGRPLPSWRDSANDDSDSDEPTARERADAIALLGFDPAELDEDEDEPAPPADKSLSWLGKASAHADGDEWQTSGRWYRRESGRTVRIAKPGAEAPAGGRAGGKEESSSRRRAAAEKPGIEEIQAVVEQLRQQKKTGADYVQALAGHIGKLSMAEVRELAGRLFPEDAPKARAKAALAGKVAEMALDLVRTASDDIRGMLRRELQNAKKLGKETPDERAAEAEQQPESGPGSERGTGGAGAGEAASGADEAVEGEAGRPERAPADQERPAETEPAGRASAEDVPAGSERGRVPADLGEVNRRLDRFEKFFAARGTPEVGGFLAEVRRHINEVGGEEALRALGEELSPIHAADRQGKEVQYWGVATGEDRWQTMGDFIQAYLGRNGISTVIEHSDPSKPLISAYGAPDKFIAEHGDFKPDIGSFANKLEESKHLPGLEKSEDVGKLMGKPVTHLTDEVIGKLDETYGKGRWIVKAYGDEAAAGYGIFFPQRAAAIRQQARDTIWQSGAELAKYGFSHLRDESGKVVGIKHAGGGEYRFGTEAYEKTIGGEARKWADAAGVATHNEHGAMLPDDGKEFMVQPAFEAVGISEADRAAGMTWHPKNEGRVHLMIRDGKATTIPHSTWLKGGNLPVVFEDDDTRAMQKAAEDAINQLPEHARRNQVYAPDIMKTPDGYRVVELNPQGDAAGSGYLTDNAFTIDAYTSFLAGREPAHVSFIRKLLAGRKSEKAPRVRQAEAPPEGKSFAFRKAAVVRRK